MRWIWLISFKRHTMNPILEKVPVNPGCSFALKEEILPYIKIGWHSHPEYELTLFTESTGKMFIGDHSDNFGPGDLLLIGSYLPHYMRNDEVYYKGDPNLRIRAIVIHFTIDFLGTGFFDIPEMIPIKKLLQNSLRGVHVHGDAQREIALRMESLLHLNGYDRLLCLLQVLHLIAHTDEQQMLSSLGYRKSFPINGAKRIDTVFAYLLQHFTENISVSGTASQVHMTTSAFCKFFKHRTGKTFSQVLNEIRIGHA